MHIKFIITLWQMKIYSVFKTKENCEKGIVEHLRYTIISWSVHLIQIYNKDHWKIMTRFVISKMLFEIIHYSTRISCLHMLFHLYFILKGIPVGWKSVATNYQDFSVSWSTKFHPQFLHSMVFELTLFIHAI